MPNLHPTASETALIAPDTILTMSDGARIPVRLYKNSEKPKAVILALHGFGDSRDAWEFAAPAYNAHAIDIVAPDLRGFGQTKDRAGWSNTQRMVQDAREQTAWVHLRYPGIPVYLMGESMGGAVALLADAENNTDVSGTILLAPAVMDIGQPWKSILAGIDAVAPNWKLDGSAVPGHRVASDNIRALRRMYFDPLTLHNATIHPLHGLTVLMQDALQKAPQSHIPLLLVFGGRDQFVLPQYTAALLKKLPAGTRVDEIPGAHHLLTRDRRGAAQDVVAWIEHPDQALPSGGDIAASLWIATAPP